MMEVHSEGDKRTPHHIHKGVSPSPLQSPALSTRTVLNRDPNINTTMHQPRPLPLPYPATPQARPRYQAAYHQHPHL